MNFLLLLLAFSMRIPPHINITSCLALMLCFRTKPHRNRWIANLDFTFLLDYMWWDDGPTFLILFHAAQRPRFLDHWFSHTDQQEHLTVSFVWCHKLVRQSEEAFLSTIFSRSVFLCSVLNIQNSSTDNKSSLLRAKNCSRYSKSTSYSWSNLAKTVNLKCQVRPQH